jgi:hypothetical protein
MSLYTLAKETGARNTEVLGAFRDQASQFKRKILPYRMAALIGGGVLGLATGSVVPAYAGMAADMGGMLYTNRVIASEVGHQIHGHHFDPNAPPSRWEEAIRHDLSEQHHPKTLGLGTA